MGTRRGPHQLGRLLGYFAGCNNHGLAAEAASATQALRNLSHWEQKKEKKKSVIFNRRKAQAGQAACCEMVRYYHCTIRDSSHPANGPGARP